MEKSEDRLFQQWMRILRFDAKCIRHRTVRRSMLNRNSTTIRNQGEPFVERKVYLVYDYEEFCGAFSSLLLAKKAVDEHLGIVKKYASSQAEKLNIGEVEYELRKDEGERTWVYSFLVKSKGNGMDLHCRRPTIFECQLDEYNSMTSRMLKKRKE